MADLATWVERVKIKGVTSALEERAKRILMSYLQTAQSYGMPVKEMIAEMGNGQAAWRLGSAVRDEILKAPPDAVRKAACSQGCAFCCILSGGEGGVITQFEAARLHEALAPLGANPMAAHGTRTPAPHWTLNPKAAAPMRPAR